MDFVSSFEAIERAAANNNPPSPGDFMADGLLMCGQCRTAKQTLVSFPGLGEKIVPCECQCAQERSKRKEEARKQREREGEIKALKSMGLDDPKTRLSTFRNDDGKNKKMEPLKKFVEQWPGMEAGNHGLLLYGGCGTGKSFGAACIANALREKGIPVYFNTTAGVVQAVQGMFGNKDEQTAFERDFRKYPLVILDDFGVERQTEYVQETLYTLIDARYRAGKPLIVTTNLPLETIMNSKEPDLSKRRIYDRIKELCDIPVDFGSAGRRRDLGKKKFEEVAGALV